MKRSFKMATAFTGVAALGAIAAPAAHAATVGPGAARVNPEIVGEACGGPVTSFTGLILQYTVAEHHSPACFFGSGTTGVGGNPAFASYCDGSAEGYVWIGGAKKVFSSGKHNLGGQHISKVQITKYSGNQDTCSD